MATIVGIVGCSLLSPAAPGDEVYRPNRNRASLCTRRAIEWRSTARAECARGDSRARRDQFLPRKCNRGQLFTVSTVTPRTIALLLLAFAGAGLALGAVGIYGVISYASQRTRARFASRLARSRAIISMVLGDGTDGAIGIALGAIGASVAARTLRTLVFGVATTDTATYVGVAAVLTVVALAASYIPARRASRVDPLVALRSD